MRLLLLLGLASLFALVLPGCGSSPAPSPPVPTVALAPPDPVASSAPSARRAPAFSMVSADDSLRVFTPETWRGETVLVDFWATWCEPCLAEIPNIAAVYEGFRDRGFRVVSVSMDFSRADLDRGRAFYAMPWDHVYLHRTFDHPVAVAFGVDRLPHAVLIAPDGTIAAEGGAARGANLRPAVERALNL